MSKYYNRNTFIDIKKILDSEDLEYIRAYSKVIGKNYNQKKVSVLLERQSRKDRKLVKQAKVGDIKARNYLFLKHILVLKTILDKKFNFEPLEFNDRLHDCFLIFINAIEEYDVKKNDNFLRFIKMYLPQRMINLLKRDSKHKKYKFEQLDSLIKKSKRASLD